MLLVHLQEKAAREDAERQLGADRDIVDGLRSDWQRKLRDRRKEARTSVADCATAY